MAVIFILPSEIGDIPGFFCVDAILFWTQEQLLALFNLQTRTPTIWLISSIFQFLVFILHFPTLPTFTKKLFPAAIIFKD